jgi:hypothetical protein
MVTIFDFKGKAVPVQAYYRPRRFQEVEAPRLTFWQQNLTFKF